MSKSSEVNDINTQNDQDFNTDVIYYDQYDTNGFDLAGYNAQGYNAQGYNAQGYNAQGFDANGYNVNGYNADGYDANGLDKFTYNHQEVETCTPMTGDCSSSDDQS